MTAFIQPNTARLWITDGSVVPFDDVVHLPARHRGTLGIPSAYKGAIDASFAVGGAHVDGQRHDDTLFAEAEWCVLFPDGIQGTAFPRG